MSDKETFQNIELPPKEYYKKEMTDEWYSIILQGLGIPSAHNRAKINRLLEDWIYCHNIRIDFWNIKLATVFKTEWGGKLCEVGDNIRFEKQILNNKDHASIRDIYYGKKLISIVRIHKKRILDDETYQYYKEEYDCDKEDN